MHAHSIPKPFTKIRKPSPPARESISFSPPKDCPASENSASQSIEPHYGDELFRLFVEVVQDYAIFTLDAEGNIRTWNAGAERIKGYTAAEIIGRHFSIFYPEEDIQAGKPTWGLQVAARDGRLEDEGWRIRKDGSRFWANVILTPVRAQDGSLVGFTKVTRDCTEPMLAKKSLEIAQQRLQESEQSLRNLSLNLLRTHDEERRLLGREMHDSLGQYLAVLKMKLDAASASNSTDRAARRRQTTECAKLVDQCLREVQTVSYLLYPPMLDEMGLKSAVPWYLEGFSRRSGIQTSFQAPHDFERLPRDTELALFRVLQESLTNIHKHSGSPTADVRILVEGNSIILEVVDRGKGFPAAILAESGREWVGSMGVGLRGMSERLHQFGGTLKITSDGTGTRLQAILPISQTATLA